MLFLRHLHRLSIVHTTLLAGTPALLHNMSFGTKLGVQALECRCVDTAAKGWPSVIHQLKWIPDMYKQWKHVTKKYTIPGELQTGGWLLLPECQQQQRERGWKFKKNQRWNRTILQNCPQTYVGFLLISLRLGLRSMPDTSMYTSGTTIIMYIYPLSLQPCKE